jgi:hypothetical protein
MTDTAPSPISDVLAAMKTIRGTAADYVQHVVSHLDDRTYRRRERPDRPYSLNGWSPTMMRDALKNSSGSDRSAVNNWRSWMRDVRAAEQANEDNLATLLRAVGLADAEKQIGYATLIRAFIREAYEVTDADLDAYYAADNKLGWIRAHANIWPGPGNDWRDPVGIGRRDQ